MTREPKAPTELSGFRRGAVLVGLTVVAGCTDAVSYLGLGRVFTANMTGNTVLLGVAVAQRDGGAAARSAAALGGFVLGATVVGLAPERKRRSVWAALVGELALLAGLLAWWSVAGATPGGGVRDGLIVLAGAAMGVQSAAVAQLAVPGVATTYITGTWTGISTGVAAWLRRRRHEPSPAVGREGRRGLQIAIVAVYLCGAVVGGLAHDSWGPGAAAIPLGVLAVVIVATGVQDW